MKNRRLRNTSLSSYIYVEEDYNSSVGVDQDPPVAVVIVLYQSRRPYN